MIFVKTNDLKSGMRLARPIYNKSGVLLFERNSKISGSAITSINNFGLLGMYILEPAEPVPPMTKEDLDFERFQTMVGFLIEEELNKIMQTGKAPKMPTIAGMIIKNYAHLDKKINFNQNLRSRENYIYKHSLNVAILSAMLTRVLGIKPEEQLATIMAAIVHDIGKISVNKDVADCDNLSGAMKQFLSSAETEAYGIIEKVFSEGNAIRRICVQSQKILQDCEENKKDLNAVKMVSGAKILAVAGAYDSLTSMQLGVEPMSEVKALKYLRSKSGYFDLQVVNALEESINILVPGVSVELNNGDKALVITENKRSILRPMILNFKTNRVFDLSDDAIFKELWIEDVMKTMDNRHAMDINTLKNCGFKVEEPEYAQIQKIPNSNAISV